MGGVNEVAYPDNTETINETLCDVSGFTNRPEFGCTANSNAAKFKGVRNKRTTVKADIVIVLRLMQAGFPGFCGLAWLNEFTTPADHIFGFAVVNAEQTFCIPMHTASHEVGHVMGLRHGRETTKEVDGNPTVFPNTQYNFGFISDPGLFYDIMAYQQSCGNEFDSFDCTQLNWFSNPNLTFNTRPTGKAAGTNGAANATQAIKDNKADVAAFRN